MSIHIWYSDMPTQRKSNYHHRHSHKKSSMIHIQCVDFPTLPLLTGCHTNISYRHIQLPLLSIGHIDRLRTEYAPFRFAFDTCIGGGWCVTRSFVEHWQLIWLTYKSRGSCGKIRIARDFECTFNCEVVYPTNTCGMQSAHTIYSLIVINMEHIILDIFSQDQYETFDRL